LELETRNLNEGKNHPPEAGPQGGCLKLDETEKFGVGFSHNVSGGLIFCRNCTGPLMLVLKSDRPYLVLDFSFVLFVEFFLDPFLVEEYPSANQPPPSSLKEQGDMIFLARLLHLGHLMCVVPMGTRPSVMVPSGH
jgi:hypothetical protein